MIIIHINSNSTQFTIIFQIWFFLASKNCNWNHKLMHFLCCCSWWVAINRARVFFWCTVLKLTYYLIFTYWWHAKNDSGECRIFWFFFGFYGFMDGEGEHLPNSKNHSSKNCPHSSSPKAWKIVRKKTVLSFSLFKLPKFYTSRRCKWFSWLWKVFLTWKIFEEYQPQ